MDPLVLTVYKLGERESWMADLIIWADDHEHLQAVHRITMAIGF